jgi:hypothetical protein
MNSNSSLHVIEMEVLETHGHWEGSKYISKGFGGYWSKWGGARMSVIQEDLSPVWFCQSCTEPQPIELTPYKFEYPKGEYIRVCAECIREGCIKLVQRVS